MPRRAVSSRSCCAGSQASGASAAEIRAVRDRLAELSVSRIGGGDELRLAEAARPPESAAAPRPLQSTIFALFASIFIAVLAALGRDLVSPRLAGPRQLTALTGLSPLVVMPSGRRRGRAARADEAYQALAASVRLQLSESQRVVVVTSPHVDAGRAEVSVGLGRALSSSGVPTLLASADLRHPMIHEKLGVPQAPGLGEVLGTLEADPGESAAGLIRTATRSHQRPSPGELRALPSGDISHHPAALLSGESLGVVFEELGHSEYRYVIVEGPPLLGPIDGQLVAALGRRRPRRLSARPDVAGRGGGARRGPGAVAGARARVGRHGRLTRELLAAGVDAGAREGVGHRCRARAPSIVPAQISPATSHRWRQWSVSMNALLASRPHQAATSAADPMP